MGEKIIIKALRKHGSNEMQACTLQLLTTLSFKYGLTDFSAVDKILGWQVAELKQTYSTKSCGEAWAIQIGVYLS